MEELMNTSRTVITYTDYQQYKAELDEELETAVESFVRVGYLLKVARDTNILKESRYENVNEFALAEYGLDKTQVSRFMRINDRFSENGYAERLKEEYRGFGHAKLSIMLQLPDSINEELTPDYSKSEIQAIKEEYDAEEQITELEVMMEEKDQVQQSLDSILTQVAYQIGRDDSKLYCSLWESQMEKNEEIRAFMERLAPSGSKTYSVRIPGIGRMMLMIKESEDEVKLISIRDASDKRTYTKQEVMEAFRSIFEAGGAKESWSNTYGASFPVEEKPPVAPVQQKSEVSKPVQRKESKVSKAKKPEKKGKPVQQLEPEEMTLHDVNAEIPEPQPIEPGSEVPPEAQPEAEPEEKAEQEHEEQQIPGQTDIVNDFKEVLPEQAQAEESKMPEQTLEELRKRAYEITKYSLLGSLDVWKGKQMPMEAILRNKKNAENLVKIFEDMEKWAKDENKIN